MRSDFTCVGIVMELLQAVTVDMSDPVRHNSPISLSHIKNSNLVSTPRGHGGDV